MSVLTSIIKISLSRDGRYSFDVKKRKGIPATLFLVHSTQILDIPAGVPRAQAHLICLPSSKLVSGVLLSSAYPSMT